MNDRQTRIVRRLRRAVKDAKAAGLTCFCDVEAWGIRIVPDEDMVDWEADPRNMGEVVELHSTCGTPNPSPKDGIPVM